MNVSVRTSLFAEFLEEEGWLALTAILLPGPAIPLVVECVQIMSISSYCFRNTRLVKKCANESCHNSFCPTGKAQRFCSKNCRASFRGGMGETHKDCQNESCSLSFCPTRNSQRFCSVSCQRDYFRAAGLRKEYESVNPVVSVRIKVEIIEKIKEVSRRRGTDFSKELRRVLFLGTNSVVSEIEARKGVIESNYLWLRNDPRTRQELVESEEVSYSSPRASLAILRPLVEHLKKSCMASGLREEARKLAEIHETTHEAVHERQRFTTDRALCLIQDLRDVLIVLERIHLKQPDFNPPAWRDARKETSAA